MIKILFICHGNICRSPIAEFLFKDLVQKQGLADCFQVASAATSTDTIYKGVGSPVYPPARNELAKHGIRCDGKRSVVLRREDYDRYDYLIGMDSANVRNMEKLFGCRGGKIYKLLSFADSDADVADPWYTDDFVKAYEDIEKGCLGLLEHLRQEEAL